MEEYILDRLEETDEAIKVYDGEKVFWLPKSKVTIVQEDPRWQRRFPDTIIVKIPDYLATLHEIA